MEAFARLDRGWREVGPHYMEAAAHGTPRADPRRPRRVRGAQARHRRALDFGRRSGEPQVLFPASPNAALIEAMLGDGRCRPAGGRAVRRAGRGSARARRGRLLVAVLALALALTDQADGSRSSTATVRHGGWSPPG